MTPVVILPPSSALGIEARSKVERQALFHVAGRGLWARNGTVVRLSPILGSLLLVLASARGRTLAYGAIIDALHGDDPEGGPLDPIGSLKVLRCRHADDLGALGVDIAVWWGCGWRLEVRRVIAFGGRSLPIVQRAAPDPYWAAQARAMKERGATWEEIGAVVGRTGRRVRMVLRGHQNRQSSARKGNTKESARRARLRRDARIESAVTGEPVEQIYARWGCATVDTSRLWDQRRAAAQSSEARP